MVNQPREHCCGCGACVAICPKSAIVMQESGCGYTYPSVDRAKCIECGLCDRICPEIKLPELHHPLAVYAACSTDSTELATCASGGAATVLSREIIRRGGAVCGCSQKDYRTIRHIRVEREDDLELLKGSKYVQSDMSGIYSDIKRDLAAGREVLFVGTPCQVAALRGYLQKPCDNLTTVDLVCHGVPSQAMLRDAVENNLRQEDNIFVNFRWKTQFGIQFGNSRRILKSQPAQQNAYMTAFLSGLSYRENCHCCPYSRRERTGDITIGDFWGLGQDTPTDIDIRRGVSLVMVNTDKGARLWAEVAGAFATEERTIGEAVKYNWNLHDPSPRPASKELFLETYTRSGLESAVRACSRRYRLESTAVMRFVRRTPILNRAASMAMRVIRRIF